MWYMCHIPHILVKEKMQKEPTKMQKTPALIGYFAFCDRN